MSDGTGADSMAEVSTSVDEMHGDEDAVQVALEYVQGALLSRIADLVDRWTAVNRFTDELPSALERVRALSVAQLVQGGMSVEEAGQAVGVNRQRANALLTEHDQPTPRQLKTNPIDQEPGHRLGVFLGIASLIAERLDQLQRGADICKQLDKLVDSAHAAPVAVTGRINASIARWTRSSRREFRIKWLLSELDQASAQLGDLPAFLGPVQQGHMWVARSSTRVRLDEARAGGDGNPSRP